MNKLKQAIINHKFFVIVLLAYIGLLIFMPDKSVQSFQNSLYYVKEMLMIMPVILLLTSLITAWVPRKTIENSFGKDSGFKGSIFSFLLGSFSAGPIYAAFPVCKALLAKGASISNIVIILSTWAVIKVPMLLNEAKFLSPKFMIIRWILTTISIFMIAYITSKLVKKEDIPKDHIDLNIEEDKLYINKDYCIGCGLCAKIAPNHFDVVNKKASVTRQYIEKDEMKTILEAIEKCPAKVIIYKN
ncbi:permease [Oscillospiraceae bacterium PP1C4]